MARCSVAVLLSASLLLGAPAAHAFCRMTTEPAPASHDPRVDGCWSQGAPLYWRSRCPTYSLQRDGTRQIPFARVKELTAQAFDAWSRVRCPGRELAHGAESEDVGAAGPSIDVREGPSVSCGHREFNHGGWPNVGVVLFHDEVWPHGARGETVALTTVSFDARSGEILDADIEVNTAAHRFSTSAAPGGEEHDYLSTLTHEAGHFLGFAHAADDRASMFAYYKAGTTSLRSLAADDVAAVCAVYPPSGVRATASGADVVASCDGAAAASAPDACLGKVEGSAPPPRPPSCSLREVPAEEVTRAAPVGPWILGAVAFARRRGRGGRGGRGGRSVSRRRPFFLPLSASRLRTRVRDTTGSATVAERRCFDVMNRLSSSGSREMTPVRTRARSALGLVVVMMGVHVAACSSEDPPLPPGEALIVQLAAAEDDTPIADASVICTWADGRVKAAVTNVAGRGLCHAGPPGSKVALTLVAPGRLAVSLLDVTQRGDMTWKLPRLEAEARRRIEGDILGRERPDDGVWVSALDPFSQEARLDGSYVLRLPRATATTVVAVAVRPGPAPDDPRDTSREFVRWVSFPAPPSQSRVDVDLRAPALAVTPFHATLHFEDWPAALRNEAVAQVSVETDRSGAFVGGTTRTTTASGMTEVQGEVAHVGGAGPLTTYYQLAVRGGSTVLSRPGAPEPDADVRGFLPVPEIRRLVGIGVPLDVTVPGGTSTSQLVVTRDDAVVWRIYGGPSSFVPRLPKDDWLTVFGEGAGASGWGPRVRAQYIACRGEGESYCPAYAVSAPADFEDLRSGDLGEDQ